VPADRPLSAAARCRVSCKTRPMRCPVRGRQPGHPRTPALAVGATASPAGSAVPPWTSLESMNRSCADASLARARERHRRPEPRARAGHLDGPTRAHRSCRLRIDVRVACPVGLHERRVCGRRPRPARPALRAGGPAPDRGGPPCRALAGSGSGLGPWSLWPAMQLQPQVRTPCWWDSRDWTDEDAVRERLERAVARFGGERLVVIAGRRGPRRRLGSPRPLGGVPAQRRDARPARRLPAPGDRRRRRVARGLIVVRLVERALG
jgi:hypothetical protein